MGIEATNPQLNFSRGRLISETAKFALEEGPNERRTAGSSSAKCSAGLEPARSHTGTARIRVGFDLPATAYKFGRRAFRHVHDIGVVSLIFPTRSTMKCPPMGGGGRSGLDSWVS
jgi:hypothetical protein